jgi:hypothetical protein
MQLGHGRDLVIKVGLWAASHSFASLVNHGCRLDQHHDVKGQRPNPVKPDQRRRSAQKGFGRPGGWRRRTATLVPKGDEFQRSAATKAKRGERNDGTQNRYHAEEGRAVTHISAF